MIGCHRRHFHAGKRGGKVKERRRYGTAELPGNGDEDALCTRQTTQRKDQRDSSSYKRWVADRAISWGPDLSSDPSRHRPTIIRRFGFAKQTSRLDRPMYVEDPRDEFRLIDVISTRTVLRFTLRSLLPVGHRLWRQGCAQKRQARWRLWRRSKVVPRPRRSVGISPPETLRGGDA